MILLLLFSISSTTRASVAQKPKPIFFFHGAQSTRIAAENYNKNISRIFWLDQNMKNDVNSQEMLCNKISVYNFQRYCLLTALHGKKFGFGL